MTKTDDILGIVADWAMHVCREAQLTGYPERVIGTLQLLKDAPSVLTCPEAI